MINKKLYNWFDDEKLDSAVISWVNQGLADGGVAPSKIVQRELGILLNTPLASGTVKSRAKTFYVLHANSQPFVVLNLINPSTFKLTPSGTVLYSVNGAKSNGTSYFIQPFAANQYSGIESDLTVAQYVSESSTDIATRSTHGFRVRSDVNASFRLVPKGGASGDVQSWTTTTQTFTSSNRRGRYIHLNNGTNAIVWRDGIKILDTAITPQVPNITANRLILAQNTNISVGVTPALYFTNELAIDVLFDRFNDTDAALWDAALLNYITKVGLS